MADHPRLMTRRRWRGKYRQIRCAVCYRLFWPWQARWGGANYFRHPYMLVHKQCGLREEHRLRAEAMETIDGR